MKKKENLTGATKKILYGLFLTAAILLLASFREKSFNHGTSINFNAPQSDTQKPLIKKNIATIEGKKLLQKDTLPKAPAFKTLNVVDLKNQIKNMRILNNVSGQLVTAPLSNAGNAAYKNGNGVVLNHIHPSHSPTKSEITLYHVICSPYTIHSIQNNVLFPIPQYVYAPPGISIFGKNFLFTYANFNDLPTGQHTYLLTVGTSISANQAKISISNAVGSGLVVFEGSDLIANAETNEIRVLFSYGNIVKGDFDTFGMRMDIFYKANNNNAVGGHFDHIQLVQID